MALNPDLAARLREFPPALQRLIGAELAAGNDVTEIGAGFPAPPVGACAKLAREVTTRPRESGDGLDFYDRNSTLYSGEWTDAKRFFFVLEPPRPYEEPQPRRIEPVVAPEPPAIKDKPKRRRAAEAAHSRSAAPETPRRNTAPISDALRRFNDSMVMTYERWHDGEGYDLTALRELPPLELAEVEQRLVANALQGWREIEALAALNTPRAQEALRQALKRGNAEIRGAVLRYAPDLADPDERTQAIIAAIKTADVYEGLTGVLDAVQQHHPPEVIDALLKAVRTAPPVAAGHYAGMLLYLHGKASEPFDWAHRPFLLRFSSEDAAERKAAYAELQKRIGR